MTDDEKDIRRATLDWTGKMVFRGGNAAGGPTILIDGDSEEGPSPVISLLLAAGACAGSDVVSILEKMKVGLESCRVEVKGRRNPEYPRRYNHLWLTFRLKGVGLTETNTQRAVQLSVEKYCSVLLTIDPLVPIETTIVIE